MKKTGEWGLYFPIKHSAHGYNETLASEYYPLTKKEVMARGWNWYEDVKSDHKFSDYKIPDNIKDVEDDITQQVLKCEISGKPYKIIPQELKFCRENGVPVPRVCPDQRYSDRMALRNPRKLFSRKCDKCSTGIQTTYSPDRPEKVYCEQCYLKEVY
jgi:hypothetical protein